MADPVVHRAELRFSPRAARWVAREEWHVNQSASIPGPLPAHAPYADLTELVMDILRHGLHVSTQALRVQVCIDRIAESRKRITRHGDA